MLSLQRTGLLLLVLLLPSLAGAETIATCGKGWLETRDGQLVLHLEGSPYEMGYQHGALLKKHVQTNLNYMLYEKGNTLIQVGQFSLNPRTVIENIAKLQRKHTPAKYFEELAGLAAGSETPLGDVVAGNFIPEMFHCSGFAVSGSATKDGTLYHGRVLDYACDWRLQEHAVLVVAKPSDAIPFVNVTYAGFIGSVTGMNARQISIGEMGGRGLGHWDGVPMALLMREVLQTAESLDTAVDVFRKNPRTCEYYYVIADGETNEAVGLAAHWNTLEVVTPGQSHPLLPRPVTDAVLLSAGDRYQLLVDRVEQQFGELTAESARRLMDRPVAMSSNLHNVLFAPRSGQFWVAHATADGEPAAGQAYHGWDLNQLLRAEPDAEAESIPLIARGQGVDSTATER